MIMRWKIEGADQSSGVTATLVVEADSQKGALAIAKARGLLATSVIRSPEVPAPIASPYRSPGFPDYHKLVRTAEVLEGLGTTSYFFAFFIVIVALVTAFYSPSQVLMVGTISAGSISVAAFVALGAVLHALAAVSLAVRDIAKNSFQ